MTLTETTTSSSSYGPENAYLGDLYKEWNSRLKTPMDLATMRDVFEEWHLPTIEPTDVTYEETNIDGTKAIWAKPLNAVPDRVLIFFHGGGGVVGSMYTHRKLAGHIAKAARAYALVLNYRLAPENPFPAAVEDGVKAYHWVLAQGFTPDHIATIGDSGGGAFAISTVVKLRELGETLPAAIVSMSPYTDMQLSGDAMEENAETECLVDRPLMEGMVESLLVGQTAVDDPLANLLYADLSELPPVFITAAELEMLRDDGVRLVERINSAGGDATLEIGKGRQHVYQFLAGRTAEGDADVKTLGDWLQPRLGL
ncbi:alpha/beta hydrolase [soil metagenome]